MPLSAITIKNVKPRETDYKLADEKGLYLLVTNKGAKLRRMKYSMHGVERKLSFGFFPDVSLADARKLRDEARATRAAGKDPAREKKVARLAATLASRSTFEAVAKDFIAKREADGLAPATLKKSRWFLNPLKPTIGKVPIAEISAPELLEALTSVQDSGFRETAKRLRSFSGRVFDFAIAYGRAHANPAIHLRRA